MRISDWSSDVCSSDLPRVECGNARSAGPDSLGKRPLWIEFQLKLPVEAAPLEQRIVANVGAHHFPNLSIREKSPKSKPGRAAIIRDHRQAAHTVAGDCIDQGLDRKSTRLNSSH